MLIEKDLALSNSSFKPRRKRSPHVSLGKSPPLCLVLACGMALACGADRGTAGRNDTIGTGGTAGVGGTATGGTSVGGVGGTGTGAVGGTAGVGGSGGVPTGGTAGTAGGGGAGGIPGPPSNVVVIAHQDDDLLFVNPDLKELIDSGTAFVAAYLTSGNAGDGMTYVQEREMGIASAYAYMAGVANAWTCLPEAYGNKTIHTCTLDAKPEVKTVFFRLVDGGPYGDASGSLARLWTGSDTTSVAVDGSGLQFTRQELIDALWALLRQNNAASIRTLDFSFSHKEVVEDDHSDHEFASLFTVAASALHTTAHQLVSFRTYTISHEPPNLSQPEVDMKTTAFQHYAACDYKMSPCAGGSGCAATTCAPESELYPSWNARQYFRSRGTPPVTGPISSNASAGQCLVGQASGVSVTACTGGVDQSWTWGADYTLKSTAGTCLTAPVLNSTTNLFMATCTGEARQRWFVMDDGKIHLAAPPQAGEAGIYDVSRCIDFSSVTPVLNDCGPVSSQSWTL